MHEHGVSHRSVSLHGKLKMSNGTCRVRNCTYRHIMVDASGLYPNRWHPVLEDHLPDLTGRAYALSRSIPNVPVRYYYIDFSCATGSHRDQPQLEPAAEGSGQDTSEFTDDNRDDQFKSDVLAIGSLLRDHIYSVSRSADRMGRSLISCSFPQTYSNVEFLRPLVLSMTEPRPDVRLSAAASVMHWECVLARLSSYEQRLRGRDEGVLTSRMLDMAMTLRLAMWKSGIFLRWLRRSLCGRIRALLAED